MKTEREREKKKDVCFHQNRREEHCLWVKHSRDENWSCQCKCGVLTITVQLVDNKTIGNQRGGGEKQLKLKPEGCVACSHSVHDRGWSWTGLPLRSLPPTHSPLGVWEVCQPRVREMDFEYLDHRRFLGGAVPDNAVAEVISHDKLHFLCRGEREREAMDAGGKEFFFSFSFNAEIGNQ